MFIIRLLGRVVHTFPYAIGDNCCSKVTVSHPKELISKIDEVARSSVLLDSNCC